MEIKGSCIEQSLKVTQKHYGGVGWGGVRSVGMHFSQSRNEHLLDFSSIPSMHLIQENGK